MKYFTYELWTQINSENKAERETAELEWNYNYREYIEYLQRIKPQIARGTRTAIQEMTEGNVSLHDFRLAGVTYSSKQTSKKIGPAHRPYKRICRLQLTDGMTEVELVLSGITQMSIEIEHFKGKDFNDLHWGYCEFVFEKPYIILSILFDSGQIWKFEFTSLVINKSKGKKEKSSQN